jgi:hypothetical protein
MTPEQLVTQLQNAPDTVEFNDVIATIDEHYHYSPGQFTNGTGKGAITNTAGSNEGSCKIFAFARLQQLDEAATLACFGRFYREEVLQDPRGDRHGNIRNFMQHGWAGIHFESPVLTPVQTR